MSRMTATTYRTDTARLARYAIAGLTGLTVDFALLIALVTAGAPLPVATVTAFLLQGVVHYALTRLWVFPHPANNRELAKAAKYAALLGFNALVTGIAVPLLAWFGLDYRLAKAVVVVALFAANYVIVPRLVLRLKL